MKTENHYNDYRDLPEGTVNWVCPSAFETLLSGASHAKQDRNGTVDLVYTDGLTESAKVEWSIVEEGRTFIEIVEAVQSRSAGAE